jgi:hypothetical protein
MWSSERCPGNKAGYGIMIAAVYRLICGWALKGGS